jgi:gamma-glutamylcyclotransferase (GGCT)/AIG2-like uncharacterized protein YtfP
MQTDFVFAYDSLMNRSEMRSRLEANGYDSSLVVGMEPAKLNGYDFVWNHYSSHRGGGLANLEQREGSVVFGVVYEIEQQLLKAFDRFHGHPAIYYRGDTRIPVQRLSDGKNILVWMYRGNANRSGAKVILPTRDYKKILVEAATFWGFPEEYLDRLRKWDVA